jgi:hypothetical protein
MIVIYLHDNFFIFEQGGIELTLQDKVPIPSFDHSVPHGWSNPVTIASLTVKFIALIFFIWRQFSMKTPMLNLRVFKYPMFLLGVVLVMISMMIPFAFLLLMPMYLQNSLGLSTIVAGLVLLPGGIIMDSCPL